MDSDECMEEKTARRETVPELKTVTPQGDVESQEKKSPMRIHQVVAALGANMSSFAYGMAISWSATAVPDLKRDEEFTHVSSQQLTWITSIITLGALSVSVPSGFMVDRLGSKRVMVIFSIPFSLGYVIMYLAHNVEMVIAGRFITGVCCGVFTFVTPIFIAEMSDPDIRGGLLSSFGYMGSFGVLFQLIIGGFLSWRNQALLGSVIPLVVLGVMYCVPESPRYLVSQGKWNEAVKSLSWLQASNEKDKAKHDKVLLELQQMKESIEQQQGESGKTNFFKEISRPEIRSAMLIGVMLQVCRLSTGNMAVFFYRLEIFESARVNLDEHMCSIILGVVDLLASFMGAGVIDRFGRKKLIIISELVMCISLGVLGGFFYARRWHEEFVLMYTKWLPLASLIVYDIGFCAGMSIVVSAVMTEVLPQRIRGSASSILTCLRWILGFCLAHFFKDLMEAVGQDGGYWFFASCCLLGAIYIFYFVPETKGKTLEEIQLELIAKHKVTE